MAAGYGVGALRAGQGVQVVVLFWVFGITGTVILLLSLAFGEVLDGLIEAIDFTGGFLSTAVIGGFLAAFGFGGALAMSGGNLSTAAATAVGVAAGGIFGGFAGWLTRKVMGVRTDRALSPSDLVGAEGTVVTQIPLGGYGEVSVVAGGHPLKLNARSDIAVPAGATVFVTASLSSSAVKVAPTS